MTLRPWIAVERHVTKRDVAFRAAAALQTSRYEAIGHLIAFWGEVSEDARAGDVSGTSDEQIEVWGGWSGEPGLFAAFVRSECVTDGVVNGWEEMQSPLEERRARDRARAQAFRDRTKASRDDNVTRNVKSRGTQHNTTQHNSTTTPPRKLAVAVEDPDPRIGTILAHYKALHPKRRPGQKDAKIVARALTVLGYAQDELESAISANAADPWHIAKGKHELSYVLRDTETIEGFRLRPKPEPLYDEAIHGPMVVDGVLSPRAQFLTDPARAEERRRQGLVA